MDQNQSDASGSELAPGELTLPPSRRILGCGSYGEVRPGILFRERVAVKFLFAKLDPDGEEESPNGWQELRREARMLAGLRHKNVVGFRGVCRDPLCIVTELCPKGSLYELIGNQEEFSRKWGCLDRLKLVAGVADGVFFLHNRSRPILHGDLKSPNVVFREDWTPVLIDFGMASFGRTGGQFPENPRWLAPELVFGEGQSTQKSDVFSLAIIMWEVLMGKHPWQGFRHFDVCFRLANGERPRIPEELPKGWPAVEEYVKLMDRCWAQDPVDRPDSTEIVKVLDEIIHRAKASLLSATPDPSLGPSPSSPKTTQVHQPGLLQRLKEKIFHGKRK